MVPIVLEEIFVTQQGLLAISKWEFDLPELDLKKLAKNKRYFDALMYAKGDGMQISEWKIIKIWQDP